jgi:hypothetical protein
MSEYTTNGTFVTTGDGYYMGIFATVEMLNDKIKKIKELESKLTESESKHLAVIKDLKELPIAQHNIELQERVITLESSFEELFNVIMNDKLASIGTSVRAIEIFNEAELPVKAQE